MNEQLVATCTFRSELRPMMAVGANARDRHRLEGNQYQYWVKIISPTTALMLVWPVRDWSEMVTLRPPASIMPWARMAPNLAMTSSCLSPMTLA